MKALRLKLKRFFKYKLPRLIHPPLKEFNSRKMPWVDKPNADIAGFIKNYPKNTSIPYDLEEKLKFWKANGYVIFENVLQKSLIDKFLNDFDELLNNRDKFKLRVTVAIPGYTGKGEDHINNIPLKILTGKYIKFLEFHNMSRAGKELMLHPSIVYFLEAIFQDHVVGFQSLTFKYGSQQPAHQDFAFVKPGEPSHLAASWIALEDVHEDSGPLFYYAGSHKIRKFNFGKLTGILHNRWESEKSTDEFSDYLVAECERLNLKRERLLINKGDLLLWHSALVHGGEAIKDEGKTRKTLVCHYSTKSTYKNHHLDKKSKPIVEEINGGLVYQHPIFKEEENYFK